MDERMSVRANERMKAAAKVTTKEEKKEKKARDSRRHSFASPHSYSSPLSVLLVSLFPPTIGWFRNG